MKQFIYFSCIFSETQEHYYAIGAAAANIVQANSAISKLYRQIKRGGKMNLFYLTNWKIS